MRGAIGIDVHKITLVVAQHDGPSWTGTRTEPALATLAVRLQALQPSVVVLEPSGGYERPVLAALQQQGVPVARVQPQRGRSFIRGLGIPAKSARRDARMLAQYGSMTTPRLTTAPTPTPHRVAALSTWRRTLRADLVAKPHQLQEQSAVIAASITRVIAELERACAAITATIPDLVETAPDWARSRAILRSCPGVGPTTGALLLAELPARGQRDAKHLASLVGVAPFTQQSGQGAGHAPIAGGRRQVRSGLWMPTLAAIRSNPVIAASAHRRHEAHKPSTVVTIACLHNLLTRLNAMVRHDECWQPRLATP